MPKRGNAFFSHPALFILRAALARLYLALMVEWRISEGRVSYAEALAFQEARAAEIAAGRAEECVWLLEHPPLITAGTSAEESDLLQPERFPVHYTGRGGEFTYHGPGQRIIYAMLNVGARGRDVRHFVWSLEEWVIRTLEEFGVKGERRGGRVGVWVVCPDRAPGPDGAPAEAKIAAIGVRLRRWVSFHGVALNVEPDLGHYDAIVPCGIRGHGVTSLTDRGVPAEMIQVDQALRRAFGEVFG